MSKLKFIATLALATLLLATAPATALAQLTAPMSLYGKVTAAGANGSEGTRGCSQWQRSPGRPDHHL
ncbi:MAG: hypothetical protein HY687_01135 [Chloroflexi bacterium]|nr:hypothetical protein [Chloroflexota bacterium]